MSGWSDEIKNLLREHPNTFSTRVIMRNFAYKKFASTAELKAAIRSFISPKSKQAKATTPKKTTNLSQDKKARRVELTNYLAKQKMLSSLIKDEIKKAFAALELI